MGAENFFVIETGKTAQAAFDRAREDALYWYGHGGYTGTIAEKGSYVFCGEVGSRYIDKIEGLVADKVYYDGYDPRFGGRKPAKPRIPDAIAPVVDKAVLVYNDTWGPAACVQITGSHAKEIKEAKGRKGSHDKVYAFFGWASS